MKSAFKNQNAKRLFAVAASIATLLSPLVARSADVNAEGSVQLALANANAYAPAIDSHQAQLASLAMEERWQRLQQTIRPDAVVKLSDEFARDYPDSKYSQADMNVGAGARKAIQALREARLSMDALDEASGDGAYRNSLTKALRGDHDAAQRVAMMYRQGANGLPQNMRRSEQWLQIAAELGSGDASWQVAQLYNLAGQVGEAARFEAKAVQAGYRLPVRLPTRSMNF